MLTHPNIYETIGGPYVECKRAGGTLLKSIDCDNVEKQPNERLYTLTFKFKCEEFC